MKPSKNSRSARGVLGCVFCLSVAACIYGIYQAISENMPRQLPPGWGVIRPPHDVFALALQGNLIWAGGTEGVWALDRQSGRIVTTLTCPSPLTYVRALVIDRSGTLWVGHLGGLTRFDGAACRTLTEEDGLPDGRVNAVFLDREDRLWVGTWDGAAIFDGKIWRVLTSADGLVDDMVNVIAQDAGGGMWFGSYVAPRGGVSRLHNGTWQVFTRNTGLPHNNITAIVPDRAGGVWVGAGLYNRGGAARLVQGEGGWRIDRVLQKTEGLAGEKVRAIFEDRSGVLWFGSEYDGLARLEDGRFRVFTSEHGLSHPEIKCLLQDPEGVLWIGTRDGITRLSTEALKVLATHKRTESKGSL